MKASPSLSSLKEQPFPIGQRKGSRRLLSVKLEKNPEAPSFLSFTENAMCLWLISIPSEVQPDEKHSFQ